MARPKMWRVMTGNKAPVFSAVLVCYNEAGNILPAATRLAETGFGELDAEAIFVDNGSSDSTGAEIGQAAAQYPFVRAVSVGQNRGYGHGILSGLSAARGEWLGWTHGDMQFDPADLLKAYRIAAGNGDTRLFVKGLRAGRPFVERFFTAGMALLMSLLFGRALWDINGQPSLFHRDFYAGWKNPPLDFTLDLYAYALAARSGLRIIRFPAPVHPRSKGESSWNRGLSSRLALSGRVLRAAMPLKRAVKAAEHE